MCWQTIPLDSTVRDRQLTFTRLQGQRVLWPLACPLHVLLQVGAQELEHLHMVRCPQPLIDCFATLLGLWSLGQACIESAQNVAAAHQVQALASCAPRRAARITTCEEGNHMISDLGILLQVSGQV